MAFIMRWKSRILMTLMLALSVSSTSAIAQSVPIKFQWKVAKTSWASSDERLFSEFVTIIGDAVASRRCSTVESCLNGPINHPYRRLNPTGMSFHADCADFPYYLRAYFAWMNQLPFGIVRNVRDRGAGTGNIRATKSGNYASGFHSFVPLNETSPTDIRAALEKINKNIHSGFFRVLYKAGDPRVPDFYPVIVQPNSVKSGTTIYNPAGHVALVYKVTPEGKVFYIDAHPDNSITSGSFGPHLVPISRPYHAHGFKNFRKVRLVGARGTSAGYVGGNLVVNGDSDESDYSTEQYVGNVSPIPDVNDPDDWRNRKFRKNPRSGPDLSYYEFVRVRLAGANLKYNPLTETADIIDQMCRDVDSRGTAVRAAATDGISTRAQPDRFPDNIYRTNGEWEEFSTPSRDARTRTLFKYLRDEVARYLVMYRNNDPQLEYSGTDLVADLWRIYDGKTRACTIQYINTDGRYKTLNLSQITTRLFKVGFDPYHCTERRWGATDAGELVACPERSASSVKSQWFDAEQRLRNQIDIQEDVNMAFDLDTLRAGTAPGTGADNPPDINVRSLLGM